MNTLSIGKSSKPNQCKVQMQSRCIFRLHWSILLTSIFMMYAAVREQKEAMKRGLIRAGRYRLRIFLLASFTKGMHVMLNTAREWRKKTTQISYNWHRWHKNSILYDLRSVFTTICIYILVESFLYFRSLIWHAFPYTCSCASISRSYNLFVKGCKYMGIFK